MSSNINKYKYVIFIEFVNYVYYISTYCSIYIVNICIEFIYIPLDYTAVYNAICIY